MPTIPADLKGISKAVPERVATWLGARTEALTGEAFSAFGVNQEEGGIRLIEVPGGSRAKRIGLKADDVVQTINGRSVKTIADLLVATKFAEELNIGYMRAQKKESLTTKK